jgi:hypothetical protein
VIGHQERGCVDNKGYALYGGSAYVTCASLRDCYAANVPDELRRSAPMTNSSMSLRPFKITKSRDPDMYFADGYYYFINGVLRVRWASGQRRGKIYRHTHLSRFREPIRWTSRQ